MAGRPVTTVGAGDPVALGAVTRTGSVTLIAVVKVNGRAAFAGRWEEPLVPSGLPAQPYHAAADLDAAAAEDMVGRGEQAAEGVLYRDAVLAAARRCGLPAHAVDAAALPEADDVLRDLGRDAGRPWRRAEKDAARAALTLLSPAGA